MSEIPFNIEDYSAFVWKPTTQANTLELDKTPVYPFQATLPEIPVLLRIFTANLVQLKTNATLPSVLLIFTRNALCALIWRSTLLIRSQRSILAQNVPTST